MAMRLDPVQENASQQRIIDGISELMDIESRARHWNNNGISELMAMQSRALDMNIHGINELLKLQSQAPARNHDGISELMGIQSRTLHRNHDGITEMMEFYEHEEDTASELTTTPGIIVNIVNHNFIGICRVFYDNS